MVSSAAQTILLVQTSFPGDTILSTPVIAGLKEIHPHSKLWVLTTPQGAELLKSDPLIEGLITYDKRGRDKGISGILKLAAKLERLSFERVYSLHRSYRTSLILYLSRIRRRIGFKQAALSFLYTDRIERLKGGHEIQRNLSLLAKESLDKKAFSKPRLFTSNDAEVLQKLGLSKSSEYGLLVPGSVWATKRWGADYYAELASKIKAAGKDLAILGSAAEASLCEKIAKASGAKNLAGLTDLSAALSVIKHAAFLVCNDSMALHAASAFDVPVVSIFGPTTPAFGFGPSGERARVVELALSCRPCSRHGLKRCPKGHFSCMRHITPQMVAKELDHLGVF